MLYTVPLFLPLFGLLQSYLGESEGSSLPDPSSVAPPSSVPTSVHMLSSHTQSHDDISEAVDMT